MRKTIRSGVEPRRNVKCRRRKESGECKRAEGGERKGK
jgi:hypothetical protein